MSKLEKLGKSCQYLDSSMLLQNPNLEMYRHTFLPADLLLPLRLLNTNYLQGCIAFELSIKKKLCIIATLYRTLWKTHNKFTNFTNNLRLTLQTVASKTPFSSLVLVDVNVNFI